MTDKILDYAKKIWERVKEWWNKFQPKQKTLIVIIVAAIILAMGILIAVLTRKQYEDLVVCDSLKEAAQVKDLLDEEGLDYKVSSDGLTFEILASQESTANLVLGSTI